jgi:hypothetical protein
MLKQVSRNIHKIQSLRVYTILSHKNIKINKNINIHGCASGNIVIVLKIPPTQLISIKILNLKRFG